MSRGMMGAAAVVVVAVIVVAVVGILVIGGDDNGAANGTDSDDPVELGQAIYNRDCFGCHTTDGSSSVGPTFDGMYGSEATYDDGFTIVVDDEHLYLAITEPRATNREGYPDVMPPFNNLEENEIQGLIAFIRSLQ